MCTARAKSKEATGAGRRRQLGVGCSQAGQHRGSTSSTTAGAIGAGGSSSLAVTPQTSPGALRECCTAPGGDLRGTVKDTSLWGLPPPHSMSLHPMDLPAQPVPLNLLCPTHIALTPNTPEELQHTPTPLRWAQGPMGPLSEAHKLPTGWDTAPLLTSVLPSHVVIPSLVIPNPPVPATPTCFLPHPPVLCHTHLCP